MKNPAVVLFEKGFTQQQIADIAGVHQSSISRLVRGKTKSIKYLPGKRLSRFLSKLEGNAKE